MFLLLYTEGDDDDQGSGCVAVMLPFVGTPVHSVHSGLHHASQRRELTLYYCFRSLTPQSTAYTLTCTLSPVHSHLYTLTCTLSPVHSHLYTLACTLTCTLSPVHSRLYTLTCTLSPVHSRLYTLAYTLTCTLSPVHSRLYTLACITLPNDVSRHFLTFHVIVSLPVVTFCHSSSKMNSRTPNKILAMSTLFLILSKP